MSILDFFKKRRVRKVKKLRVTLPKDEVLVLTEFNLDDKPHVALFNKSIMTLNPKETFGWYLSLCVLFDATQGEDMPVNNDIVRMQDFSDNLIAGLAHNISCPNALFLGRVTGAGRTQMMWYVNDPEMAHRYLQRLISSKKYPFQFDYKMEYDGEWREGHYWLDPLMKK